MSKEKKDNRKRKKDDFGDSNRENIFYESEGREVIAQSPISLEVSNAELLIPLSSISLFDYWRPDMGANMMNNGITALMTFPGLEPQPKMSGGPMNGAYIFEQLHFHWNLDDCDGSEHLINGIKYAGEAHLVHFNRKYENFDEALTKSDGLAVLGIMMEISKKPNLKLQAIIDAISKVPRQLQEAKFTSDDVLRWMLDVDLTEGYFTYKGSLTTEPFYESVTWIVYVKTIPISKCQMEAFRKMEILCRGQKTHCNRRSLQPRLPGLKVQYVPSRKDPQDIALVPKSKL